MLSYKIREEKYFMYGNYCMYTTVAQEFEDDNRIYDYRNLHVCELVDSWLDFIPVKL